MNKLRDRVVGCKRFMKLDVRNGYFLVQLKDKANEKATTMYT
jgi:hypothetical protein